MIVERTAVVPLPLEETWEAFFGNEMQNWCELSDMVVEVRDYRMRADRTPEYVMVDKAGPMKASHRSDYVVYDPPHRAEDDTLDSMPARLLRLPRSCVVPKKYERIWRTL
jgi:hypothetical protein